VLAVVGLCLPLLVWIFGEPGSDRSETASRQRSSAHAAAPLPLTQAPGPVQDRDVEGAGDSAADTSERPTPPSGGGIGPEPAWGDPTVWTGSSPAEVVTTAPVYTATVTGRVVDARGHPVPGVRVSGILGIISCWGGPSKSADPNQQSVTGPDGRFRLDISSEHVLPTHLGLGPPKATDLLPRQADLEGLGHGDTRDLGDLALVQGGRVEGRATDPTGRPLAGVTIRTQQGSLFMDRALGGAAFTEVASWNSSSNIIVNEYSGISAEEVVVMSGSRGGSFRGGLVLSGSDGPSGPSATTGEDGRFVLHSVPPGNHTLVASLRPYALARRDGVVVRAGLATRGIELGLTPGPVLEVEVLDERGVPVKGAVVMGTDDEGASFNSTTNARGIATSPPLTSPRVDLSVAAEGHLGSSTSLNAPAGARRLRARVTLGAASTIRLQAEPTGSVFALRRGGSEWLSPEQQEDTFLFRGLSPGRYDILFNGAEGLGTLASDVQVRSGEPLELGRLTPTLLEPLRVRVVDAEGRPLAGASLQPLEATLNEVMTDESGEVDVLLWPGDHPHRVRAFGHSETISVLRAGPITTIRLEPASAFLTVRAGQARDPQGDLRARQLTLRRLEGAPTSVTFVERTRVPLPAPGRYAVDLDGHACGVVEVAAGQEVEFVAQEPRPLETEITIQGSTGRALAGAEVSLSTVDPRVTSQHLFPAVSAVGHTDARGVAKLSLQRGPAVRELFAQVVSEGQTRVFRFSLGEGSRIQRTLQLPRSANTQLEVDAGGVALAGSQVELTPLTAQSARTQVATLDASGRVSFRIVLPGRYRVSVKGEGESVSREVEVGTEGTSISLGSSSRL
jgi:hypothetical protein